MCLDFVKKSRKLQILIKNNDSETSQCVANLWHFKAYFSFLKFWIIHNTFMYL